jgi:hypothetical protein
MKTQLTDDSLKLNFLLRNANPYLPFQTYINASANPQGTAVLQHDTLWLSFSRIFLVSTWTRFTVHYLQTNEKYE